MSQFDHLPLHPRARMKVEPDATFTIVVSSGVTSSGLTLTSVEYEEVLSGGIAISNTIDSGGQVTVDAGGRATGDMISSGGTEIVSSGGSAIAATVSAGGLITGAGLIDDASIYGFAAGLSVGPTDDFLGYNYVESGGVTSALTVVNDGDLIVSSSGEAVATHVNGGGILVVASSGLASGSVILNGGALDVEGEADATRISSGGYASVEGPDSSSTALLSSATILNGGMLVIDSGGEASTTTISSGGTVQLDQEGVLSSATMHGGTLVADLGAIVSGLTIASGGLATLRPGSVGYDVNVISGTLSIGAFSQVGGLTLSSGGVFADNGVAGVGTAFGQPSKVVLAGQLTGSGYLVEAGGTMDVTGATSAFMGELILEYGTIELATAAGAGQGSVAFDNFFTSETQTVQIDAANQPANGATYSATLVDFNNSETRLDLTGVAFKSGATAKAVKNVLTVTDGAYIAKFTLGDSRGKTYVVASDGKGGTLIRPSNASTVVPLVHAAAGFLKTEAALGSLATIEPHGADISPALAGSAASLRPHQG